MPWIIRAERICSSELLASEMQQLKTIFMKNGYPKSIVDRYTGRDSTREKTYGPSLSPVYMKLPYVGTNSDRFERFINEAARMAHYCVKVHAVFTTTPAFRVRKDRLPTPNV